MKRSTSLLSLALLSLNLIACTDNQSGGKGAQHESKQTSSAGKSDSNNKASSRSDSEHSDDSVTIESADQKKAGISVAPVEVESLPQVLTLNGEVAVNEQRTSHVGVVADGRVTALNVLPGASVRRGAVLGQVHSHSVHETAGALMQAFAALEHATREVNLATQSHDRYDRLYAIQAASLEEKQKSEQDLAQARQSLADAQANVHMEREHLSELLQVSPQTLTPNNLYDRELVPIRSPIDGIVTSRSLTVGQVVDTGTEAFVVSDLSTVWVMAAANERDISSVRKGANVDVTTQAFPDTPFRGTVEQVGNMLDPQTRTLPVRLVLPNPHYHLRPGMFAAAHIAGSATRQAVFIPEKALQNINGNEIVFLTKDGTTFRPQVVKSGTRSQGRTEIVQGLKPGDRIAVNGAFMVKGELLKSTVGDG